MDFSSTFNSIKRCKKGEEKDILAAKIVQAYIENKITLTVSAYTISEEAIQGLREAGCIITGKFTEMENSTGLKQYVIKLPII